MGLGDFIDSVGNALDDVAQGAEHLAGSAVDAGAHVVGGALNTLGLHDAATSVDNAGDWVADHLGDPIAEQQLGQTSDPTQLIHGNMDKIGQTVSDLHNFTTAFGDTAQGLAGVDTAHWQGDAAEAFRATYHQHPQQWSDAQEACQAAADAMQHYSTTVGWAQEQAQQAIDLYQKGVQATGAAVAQHARAVSTYDDAANAYSNTAAAGQASGPAPRPPAAFVDPGAADCQHAKDMLSAARQKRDSAGSQAQQAIAKVTATAPATPSFGRRMLDDVEDTFTASAVEGEHVVGGVAKGVGDITKFVRGINPLDPYNVTHPAGYLDHMSQTAAGLVHTGLHPQELVTGMVGTGWGSDPAEALGHLVPNVVATIGSDGVGAAAEGADAGAAAAETAGQAAGRAALDDASTAGGTAARDLAHPTVDPTPTEPVDPGPGHGWGDFGPTGNPDLHAADSTAAGGLDAAGEGLGNFSHDISGVHAHADSTTATSSSGVLTPSAAHAPPRLPESSGAGDASSIQSRLNGAYQTPTLPLDDADAAATQDITDAGGGLGKLEHDEGDVQVRQPEGPEYNNPDYSDPQYKAGRGVREAYDRRYPPNSGTRRFVDDTRAEHPGITEPLTDQEISALNRMTGMDHMDINKALRDGDQAALERLDPEIRNAVSGLNKLPDYIGPPVRRGIDVAPSDLDSVLDKYTPGQTVSEPAFTHSDKAVPFSGNVQFVINGGPAKDVSFLRDPSVGQQEVMYPPGAKFEVLSKKYDPETQQWKIFLKGL